MLRLLLFYFQYLFDFLVGFGFVFVFFFNGTVDRLSLPPLSVLGKVSHCYFVS